MREYKISVFVKINYQNTPAAVTDCDCLRVRAIVDFFVSEVFYGLRFGIFGEVNRFAHLSTAASGLELAGRVALRLA